MHLNHFLAQAGICSRRKAAELIKEGQVRINGAVKKEPGYQVKPTDVAKNESFGAYLSIVIMKCANT